MVHGRWWGWGVLVWLIGLFSVHAQEISASAGVMGTGVVPRTSYAWQLEYRHPIDGRFAWSASWLNEGHTPEHHRDGVAFQGWAMPILDPDDFSLALGAGMYHYADTRFWPGDGYTNEHGWAPILSISATFYTDSPWFFRLTGNHVMEREGFETNSIVTGIGYHLGWLRREESRPRAKRSAHVLTVMGGRTIVNSRGSEQTSATVVEYRKIIGRHWDWTFSWLDEGDAAVMRREGAATQLWLTDAYPTAGINVGLGAGPYYLFTQAERANSPSSHQPTIAMIVSPSIAVALGDSWQARLTWNRVFSRNDHDADVIVVGLGFRWGRK